MASYIAVISHVLFLLKSFEERGFQKSVFQVKSDSYKGWLCKNIPWKILKEPKNNV